MRIFTEFSFDKDDYKLEVDCHALKSGEVEELIGFLEDRDFKLTFIDADSLRGEYQSNSYLQIQQIRNSLRDKGFTWSEETKETISEEIKEEEEE